MAAAKPTTLKAAQAAIKAKQKEIAELKASVVKERLDKLIDDWNDVSARIAQLKGPPKEEKK